MKRSYRTAGNFDAHAAAEDLLTTHHVIYYLKQRQLWVYSADEGLWYEEGKDRLHSILDNDILPDHEYTIRQADLIIQIIKNKKLSTAEYIPVPLPHLIPANNCIYNLKTGKSHKYSHNHFFTTKFAVNYVDGEPECPTIDRIFKKLARPEDEITLWELAAYCLWRGMPYQKIFFLYGRGANGKSVYTNIIARMLGMHNVSTADLSSILTSRFSPGLLWKRYANIAGDMGNVTISGADILKKASGDDPMECERKNIQAFSFRNFAKLIFNTNHIPPTKDKDFPFYRRITMIEFPNTFRTGSNAEASIVDTIPQSEFEGFFAKCLGHLKTLRERDFVFTHNKQPEDIAVDYEALSDPFAGLLNCIHDDSHGTASVAYIRKIYDMLAASKNIIPMTPHVFNKDMRARGYIQDSGTVNGVFCRLWKGFTMKTVNLRPDSFSEGYSVTD